jgi:mediator of RNA polymerase II transcription subunit 14
MDPSMGITASASLHVLDKSKFKLLNPKVDHDVSFNHRSGEFALRIRAGFGESMISTLGARLQAIERLVEFLDSIGRNQHGVECETVTLRKVVFTYGDPPPPTAEAGAEGAPAAPQQATAPRRCKVWLDLTKPNSVRLTLEQDNPHMRVLDMLQTLVNSETGLQSLPFWLPVTLSAVRGLEAVDESWQQLQTSRKGTFEIFSKALEWATMRYTLASAPGAPPRRLNLDVRLRQRRGEAWWHVWRSDPKPAPTPTGPAPLVIEDEFDKALSQIWCGKGTNWKGLSSGAAGKPALGIEELLRTVDQTVRTVLESPPPAAVPQQQQLAQPMQQGQQQQPQQHQQQQQPQLTGPQLAKAQIQAQAKAKAQAMAAQQGLGNNTGGNRPPHGQRPGGGGGGQARQNRPAPQAPMGNVVDLT